MNNILTTLAATKIETEYLKDGDQSDFGSSITSILNWIIGILGIVAVIVIIMGGVTYMTSAGDAGKVKKGKDTILYGIIGLIIAALAFAVVNFVIGGIMGD